MFRDILIPLDGSGLAECAVSCAVSFARAFGAHVTLLRVLEKAQNTECLQPIDPLEWSMYKREANTYLSELGALFETEGIKADVLLKEGHPAQRILEAIQEKDIDLMVVSSHGKSGLSGWSAGSGVPENHSARTHLDHDYPGMPLWGKRSVRSVSL